MPIDRPGLLDSPLFAVALITRWPPFFAPLVRPDAVSFSCSFLCLFFFCIIISLFSRLEMETLDAIKGHGPTSSNGIVIQFGGGKNDAEEKNKNGVGRHFGSKEEHETQDCDLFQKKIKKKKKKRRPSG